MAAFDFREHNLRVYGVELPLINPWTSQPVIVDTLFGLFEGTTRCIEADSEASEGNSEQLPELASILLACIQERLDWLGRFAFFSGIDEYR